LLLGWFVVVRRRKIALFFTIIGNETKEALISEDPKSAEILKPILRGRDIKRYQAEWAKLWLIDTHNGYGNVAAIDIENYPAVKNYLDKFYPELEKRQDKGRTPYNLRNCAYHAEFAKEKLLWMDLTTQGRFVYDANGAFCSNTAFIMTGQSIKYLCALLNSHLITWIMRHTSLNSGMGVTRWIASTVEKIPVPKIPETVQEPFIQLVDKILSAKDTNPEADISGLEAKINQRIYKLYALTQAEVSIIESSIL